MTTTAASHRRTQNYQASLSATTSPPNSKSPRADHKTTNIKDRPVEKSTRQKFHKLKCPRSDLYNFLWLGYLPEPRELDTVPETIGYRRECLMLNRTIAEITAPVLFAYLKCRHRIGLDYAKFLACIVAILNIMECLSGDSSTTQG
ncbi:hypothetical protein NXS19_011598 [Fusarium pseudograminearum]|nr:hypothetical protein NXS19_011598 [Fusarium pseudograminearum]